MDKKPTLGSAPLEMVRVVNWDIRRKKGTDV
jgi:hypothetical protein